MTYSKKTRPIEYNAWKAMKTRCYNKNHSKYNYYGGRGIIVCERWKNSFHNFVEDMGFRPGKDYSLDRHPDNNGNYEPDNCRWATRTEQQRNRRNNNVVTYRGVTKTASEWAEGIGLKDKTSMIYRIASMGIGKAITTPVRRKESISHNDEAIRKLYLSGQRVSKIAKELNIKYHSLYTRLIIMGYKSKPETKETKK